MGNSRQVARQAGAGGPGRRDRRVLLLQAINDHDLEAVAGLLADDPSLANAKNAHHNVPLDEAIESGSLELVQALVAAGADISHRNHGGRSLLDVATFGGHDGIARFLISQGVEPSVLHLAALDDVAALRELPLADCVSVAPAGGRWWLSPLHAAAMSGAINSADFLLDAGADVNAVNHHGHTPLAMAIERGTGQRGVMIKLLLSRGADANAAGGHHQGSVLHRAIIRGDGETTQALLAAGAEVDWQDASGKTALHHAVTKNGTLTALVLKSGPVLGLTTRQGETALQLAIRLKKKPAIALLIQQ